MTKRGFFILLAVLALVIASLACGDSTPEVKPAQESGEESEQEAATEPTTPPSGASRSNPAPVGSEVTVGDLTLAVDDATRPADEIVAEGNMFNPTPEPGNEFVRVTISATCEKAEDETCSVGPAWNLALIGSAGVTHDPLWAVSGVDGQLEQTEFYGAASVSGSLFFEVGQDETQLVLRYEDILGLSKAFLALP
jgi:hypothetical protein